MQNMSKLVENSTTTMIAVKPGSEPYINLSQRKRMPNKNVITEAASPIQVISLSGNAV